MEQMELIGQEAPLAVPEDELERLAQVAEKRVEAVRKILQAALRLTNYQDWVDMGGRPYLTATGAEKLGAQFQISILDLQVEENERQDKKGKWIEFVAKARFRMGEREIEAVGTCSTRTKFFGFVRGELKELEEVDLPSVRKAAISNCKRSGILTLLGLRSPTYEDLKAAGIPIEKIPRVEYKKGGSR